MQQIFEENSDSDLSRYRLYFRRELFKWEKERLGDLHLFARDVVLFNNMEDAKQWKAESDGNFALASFIKGCCSV